MRINVKLGTESINDAIDKLKEYKKDLETVKMQKFLDRVAEELAEFARQGFSTAGVDMQTRDGGFLKTADAQVTVKANGKKGRIVVASGKDVIFAEFGAGVYLNGSAGDSPHPKGNELGYTIGGYGKGHGRRNVWVFRSGDKRIYTHGTPASMPMRRALESVEDRIADIAKAVFKT